MKQILFSTIFLLQVATGFGQSNGKPSKQIDQPGITARVDALVKEYTDMDIFSGVVLIAVDGKPFYQKPFGMADRAKKTPNTLDTKFVIGSMNKTFTQVVVLQLIEESKLKYTDRLVEILDGFTQRDADKITVEHLLNHTSGFGDYHGPQYWNTAYEQKNIPGLTELIKKLPLHFPPGTENEYSNAGYILLGAIIEKVSGKSFAENVWDRIVKPLQLKNTWLEKVKEVPGRAIGYLKTLDGVEDNEGFITEPRSDGGFYATAGDVLLFYRNFFYGTKLLKESTKENFGFFKRMKPMLNEQGRGLPIAGGFNGANTVHMEMPADNISIVVMANMDEPVAEKICLGIHAIINGKEPPKAALPAKLNVFKAYAASGADHVKQHFEALTVNWHPGDPKDMILNNLGYDLLSSGKTDQAIDIFKLNTELFPKIGNCWDSYGEALLKKGDRKAALEAYKKALEINPDIPSAKEAVKKLENE